MLLRFLKIAWRHFTKTPDITIIKVISLTIGLTVYMLIALWVNNQLSFDRFSENADRIYRLESNAEGFDGHVVWEPPVGPALMDSIEGVEDFVRFNAPGSQNSYVYIDETSGKRSEAPFYNSFRADESFFRIFNIECIYGDYKGFDNEINSTIIQESISRKLFGKINPVGKEVFLLGNDRLFTVKAVIANINNFHIPFQSVHSIENVKDGYVKMGIWEKWGGAGQFPTFLLLKENSDPKKVEKEIDDFLHKTYRREFPNARIDPYRISIRPLKEIYFKGDTPREFEYFVHGDKTMVLGLSAVGFLVLILSLVNFVNLKTTGVIMRSREIGIRKASGAQRTSIIFQHTGEAFILVLLSLILSFLIIYYILPYFNNLISGHLYLEELFNQVNILTLSASLIAAILIAGLIPSLSLSSINPVKAMRIMDLSASPGGQLKQRLFLAMQYAITIVVIAATFIVQKQTRFMIHKEPGFETKNILATGAGYDPTIKPSIMKIMMEERKRKFLDHPDVINFSYCHHVPSNLHPSYADYSINGKRINFHEVFVYPAYFDILEIPFAGGRNFDYNNPGDRTPGTGDTIRLIINEAAVRAFELANPVGYIEIRAEGKKPIEIIGVVKDFHFTSLKSPIVPIIFSFNPMAYASLIKIKPGSRERVEEFIYELNKAPPGNRKKIESLYEIYYGQYEKEKKLSELFLWLSVFSIIIAASGLYGISANAIQSRIKEIGVRKAHGATSWHIVGMLQVYYGKIILISGLVGIPLSFLFLTRWLSAYYYKTGLSWWIFFWTLVLAALVSVITVSWKSWAAANEDPVEAINYE